MPDLENFSYFFEFFRWRKANERFSKKSPNNMKKRVKKLCGFIAFFRLPCYNNNV